MIDTYNKLKAMCGSMGLFPFNEDDGETFRVFAVCGGFLNENGNGVVCYNTEDEAVTTYSKESRRYDHFTIDQDRKNDLSLPVKLSDLKEELLESILIGYYERAIMFRRNFYARQQCSA